MYKSVSPFGEGSKTSNLTLITAFTGPHPGLCPKPYESSPHPFHPIPLRSILILSLCLHLDFPYGCLTSGFIPSTMYTFLLKG